MKCKIRPFRALAITMVALVLLAACGSAANSSTNGTGSSQAVVTTAAVSPTAVTPAETVVEDAREPTATTAAQANSAATEGTAPATDDTAASNAAVEGTESTISVATKLNLNEVTEDELLSTIPGFGNRMVHEFFEYRPYVSILEFRREIGKYVDEAQVAAYEQYVYVPVDVNESDVETLQQLPGVDETVAAALTAARPYDSIDAFLAKLGEHVSADELVAAASYLVAE